MTARRPKAARARSAPVAPLFPAAAIRLLGQAPDPEIAERFGLTTYRVKGERKARGIAPVPPRGGPGRPPSSASKGSRA